MADYGAAVREKGVTVVLTFASVPCLFVGFSLGLFLGALAVAALACAVAGRDE